MLSYSCCTEAHRNQLDIEPIKTLHQGDAETNNDLEQKTSLAMYRYTCCTLSRANVI